MKSNKCKHTKDKKGKHGYADDNDQTTWTFNVPDVIHA